MRFFSKMINHPNLTAIKRNSGGIDNVSLDGLFGYDAGDVENKNKIEVLGSDNLSYVLKYYFAQLSIKSNQINNNFKYKLKTVLTPKEINDFIQMTISFEDNKQYDLITKYAIDCLIENSYSEGNDEFNLDFTNTIDFSYLFHIRVNYNLPIKINSKGNLGDCVCRSENMILTHDGNLGENFGFSSNNLLSYIKGNVGPSAGDSTLDFKSTIVGDVGSGMFGDCSKGLVVSIKGDIHSFPNSYPRGAKIYLDGGILGGHRSFLNSPEYFIGAKARENPEYQQMMAEWNRRFGE